MKAREELGAANGALARPPRIPLIQFGKINLAIVAPGYYMHRPPGGIHAGRTGHGNLKDRSARTISLTI